MRHLFHTKGCLFHTKGFLLTPTLTKPTNSAQPLILCPFASLFSLSHSLALTHTLTFCPLFSITENSPFALFFFVLSSERNYFYTFTLTLIEPGSARTFTLTLIEPGSARFTHTHYFPSSVLMILQPLFR